MRSICTASAFVHVHVHVRVHLHLCTVSAAALTTAPPLPNPPPNLPLSSIKPCRAVSLSLPQAAVRHAPSPVLAPASTLPHPYSPPHPSPPHPTPHSLHTHCVLHHQEPLVEGGEAKLEMTPIRAASRER